MLRVQMNVSTQNPKIDFIEFLHLLSQKKMWESFLALHFHLPQGTGNHFCGWNEGENPFPHIKESYGHSISIRDR